MNARQTLYDRYEWISYHLERQAYRQQMKNRQKPLKRFKPCEKALVFTAAMAKIGTDDAVTSLVIPRAALTICSCHSGLGGVEIWDLYDQAIKAVPHGR